MQAYTYTQYLAFSFRHEYIQLSDTYFPYETGNITNTRQKFGAIFFAYSKSAIQWRSKKKGTPTGRREGICEAEYLPAQKAATLFPYSILSQVVVF